MPPTVCGRHRHPAGLSHRRDRLQRLPQPSGLDLPLTLQYLQNRSSVSFPTRPNTTSWSMRHSAHGGDASSLQPFLMRTPTASRLFVRETAPTSRSTSFPAAIRSKRLLHVTGLPSGATAIFQSSDDHRRRQPLPSRSFGGTTAPGVYPSPLPEITGHARRSAASQPHGQLFIRRLLHHAMPSPHQGRR